jgi:hypothetical protein
MQAASDCTTCNSCLFKWYAIRNFDQVPLWSLDEFAESAAFVEAQVPLEIGAKCLASNSAIVTHSARIVLVYYH